MERKIVYVKINSNASSNVVDTYINLLYINNILMKTFSIVINFYYNKLKSKY